SPRPARGAPAPAARRGNAPTPARRSRTAPPPRPEAARSRRRKDRSSGRSPWAPPQRKPLQPLRQRLDHLFARSRPGGRPLRRPFLRGPRQVPPMLAQQLHRQLGIEILLHHLVVEDPDRIAVIARLRRSRGNPFVGAAGLLRSVRDDGPPMRLLHLPRLQPQIADLERLLVRLDEGRVLQQMLVDRLVAHARLARRQHHVAGRREPFEEHFLALAVEQLPLPRPPHLQQPVLVRADAQLFPLSRLRERAGVRACFGGTAGRRAGGGGALFAATAPTRTITGNAARSFIVIHRFLFLSIRPAANAAGRGTILMVEGPALPRTRRGGGPFLWWRGQPCRECGGEGDHSYGGGARSTAAA